MDSPTPAKLVIVVTVTEDGTFTHKVLQDGKPVENVSLGLQLAGPLTLSVAAGVTDAQRTLAIARQAEVLVNGLRDSLFLALVKVPVDAAAN